MRLRQTLRLLANRTSASLSLRAQSRITQLVHSSLSGIFRRAANDRVERRREARSADPRPSQTRSYGASCTQSHAGIPSTFAARARSRSAVTSQARAVLPILSTPRTAKLPAEMHPRYQVGVFPPAFQFLHRSALSETKTTVSLQSQASHFEREQRGPRMPAGILLA